MSLVQTEEFCSRDTPTTISWEEKMTGVSNSVSKKKEEVGV